MQASLALLPPVKRARGYRLYTGDKRIVDLYLDGGRAALGHNAPGVLREMKNAAERSLFAPYPSCYTRRFEKALTLLFPGKSCVVYETLAAVPAAIRKNAPVWRPFMKTDGAALLALLPHPLAPVALAVEPRSAFAAPEDGRTPELYGKDFRPSPVILALTTRAIYDVLHTPERGAVAYRRVDEALAAGGTWKREGIYLSLKERADDAAWTAVFKRFLDAGFLIPPTQDDPLVLPGELSEGEEAKLGEVFTHTAH